MNALLDAIEQAITRLSLPIDVGIASWGDTSFEERVFENATATNINTLRSFVNGIDGDGDGANFNKAATGAKIFFEAGLSKKLARRVFLFITDGEPFPASSDDVAAATIAYLFDESSGQFSSQIGTRVDCHGINIELSDIAATTKLDNTRFDGLPVVSSDDPSGLISTVQTALFAD